MAGDTIYHTGGAVGCGVLTAPPKGARSAGVLQIPIDLPMVFGHSWKIYGMKKQALGRTGFEASVIGIGDLADRSVALEQCVATVHRAMD